MTTYILPNKEKIQVGKGFTYKDYQYTNNWFNMKDIVEDLKLKEIIYEPSKSDKFYNNSWDKNGKWNGTEKELNDVPSVDEDNKPVIDLRTQKQRIHLGLISTTIRDIKKQQKSLLAQTDHWYVRKADTGEEVPANVQAWRDNIRKRASVMEEAVKKVKSIKELKDLHVRGERNDKGEIIQVGILYDFGQLKE